MHKRMLFIAFFFVILIPCCIGVVWQDLKVNGNGKIIAAISSITGIVMSKDGGANWYQLAVPRIPWKSLSVSSNGQSIVAAASMQGLYVLSQNQSDWGKVLLKGDDSSSVSWKRVAMSSSSQYLLACTEEGIYRSADFGNTWQTSLQVAGDWQAVNIDITGTNMVALGLLEGIYVSSDSGVNWRPSAAPTSSWVDVACSASGQRCVAATIGEGIYFSDDFGFNWILSTAPQLAWTSIACDHSGKIVLAASQDGIYYYLSAKSEWKKFSLPPKKWSRVAIAGDASLLFAVADGDRSISRSADLGRSWKQLENRVFQEFQDSFILQRDALSSKFKADMLVNEEVQQVSLEDQKKERLAQARRHRKAISQSRLESQWKPRKNTPSK